MIDNQSYFDILYEHCHYFTAHSLEKVFINNGFYVDAIYTGYGKQFLCIEASLTNKPNPGKSTINVSLKERKETILSFGNKFKSTISNYKKSVQELQDMNNRIVIWGAGSKGITLLNVLNIPEIKYVVDINIRKHQHYISGTDIKIVSPEFLASYKPTIAIITNPMYKKEISQLLGQMHLPARIMSF
jgi:hypothetical protein